MPGPLKLSAIIACAVCLFGGPQSSLAATDNSLPDIGSSAGEMMSPEQQREYGEYMLHEMRGLNLILDDPLLSDYINTLGFRLVAHSDKPEHPFFFFLVRDNTINAFAAPGGFIGVNAGLITTTESESELAAVIAHEIAHITQSHLVRAFEDAKKNTIPIALAMLGAVLASRNRTDDAAQAAIVAGTSLIQQTQINFTRHDEAEADRVGIQTLARSDFEPQAMAGFFGRMQRALRPGIGEDEAPELLRTHPVTIARISDAKSRADVISDEIKKRGSIPIAPIPANPLLLPIAQERVTAASSTPSIKEQQQANAYYQLMRERIRVLSNTAPNQIVAYYTDNHHDRPGFNTEANRYGLALAHIANGNPQKALETLRALLAEQPGQLVFQLAAAQAETLSGQRQAALKRYTQLELDFPRNSALAMAHASALLESADKTAAQHAMELLRPQIADKIDDPYLHTLFGRACELSGDPIRASEAHAEAALLNGHFEDAINQLRALSKRTDLNYYQRARVDARIAALTPVVLELRRRHIKPGDQGTKTALSKPKTSDYEPLSLLRNNPKLQ